MGKSLFNMGISQPYNVIIEWNGTTASWLIDGHQQESFNTASGFGAVAPKLCYTNSDTHEDTGSGAWTGKITGLRYSKMHICKGEGFGLEDAYNFSSPFRLSFEVMANSTSAHHGQIFSARRSSGTVVEVSWSDSKELTLSLCNGTTPYCEREGNIISKTPALSAGAGYVVLIEWNGTLASWSVDGVQLDSWPSNTGFGTAYPIVCRPPSNDLQTGFLGQVADLHLEPYVKVEAGSTVNATDNATENATTNNTENAITNNTENATVTNATLIERSIAVEPLGLLQRLSAVAGGDEEETVASRGR